MKKKYGVDPRGFFPAHTSGRPNESTDEPLTARPGGEGSLDCSNEGARGGEGEENGRAAGEGGMGNGGVEALVEAADTRPTSHQSSTFILPSYEEYMELQGQV